MIKLNKFNLNVIHETNHYIVVEKPSGILSQEDITKDPNMMDIIKDYLKVKYNKPGNVFLGLVHRLDRMTSGLMVYAKTSKGASRISDAIRNKQVTKKYICLVEGILSGKGTLTDKVIFDEKLLKAKVSDSGKEAILKYNVLEHIDGNTILEVELITGRHHQIRLQLSNISHPLVGDTLYGSKTKCNIKLHAYYLKLIDPVSKEEIEFIKYPNWYNKK